MISGDIDLLIDLRTGGDWSLDLCRAGLIKNGLTVFDFPWREKHREWNKVVRGEVTPDWGMERRTLGYVVGYDDDDSIEKPSKIYLKDVKRIWLDERMESYRFYRENGFDALDAEVIVVAGHDRFWNVSPDFVASLYGDKLKLMLLDNWSPEYDSLLYAKRIGWSTNFDHYWKRKQLEKTIDICFVGYNSHPDRDRFISHIRSRWSGLNNFLVLEKEPDTFKNFLPKSDLFDIMAQSKVCLNLRGAAESGKTLRSYEIPYVGSLMLSQRCDQSLMNDFSPLCEAVYFSNEDELDDYISYFLVNPSVSSEIELKDISTCGHDRATSYLTAKSRWGRVLKSIGVKGHL